jgi:hypothetical protein
VSAGTVAAMLADLIEPPGVALALVPTAKAANPANREYPCGAAAASVACENLRNPAKAEQRAADTEPDSQTFAAIRKPENEPQSKHWRGCSQDSQDSQGCPAQLQSTRDLDLAAVAWTDADIARFLDRRARLLRWGWAEPEAEKLADRLVRRDREADERVSCTDCRHYRPGRCGNHKTAGLGSADVGRDLATQLQRCPAFEGPRARQHEDHSSGVLAAGLKGNQVNQLTEGAG